MVHHFTRRDPNLARLFRRTQEITQESFANVQIPTTINRTILLARGGSVGSVATKRNSTSMSRTKRVAARAWGHRQQQAGEDKDSTINLSPTEKNEASSVSGVLCVGEVMSNGKLS